MNELALHILDLAENSARAGASLIRISVLREGGWLVVRVEDNGRGIDAEKAADPFFTSKQGKRFGLGIPLLRQTAEECGGGLEIRAAPGGGTVVEARFKLAHVDMKPVGDLGATVAGLIAGCPEADVEFVYRGRAGQYRFETRELREQIEGLPLNTPQVLQYISQEINEGVRRQDG